MNSYFNKIFDLKVGLVRLLIGFIGLIIGLSIVILSSELYQKVSYALNNTEDAHYLMLNKRVSLLANTLLNQSLEFSDGDMKEINEQPFILKAAEVSSSNYRVTAKAAGIFHTDLFFESVPTDFVDVKSYKFKWREGEDEVPIIIPRDFLHLYNFGFAQSQGGRPISAGALKNVSVDLILRNDTGDKVLYTGKIVGLSDRISTILVPQNFNSHINSTFSSSKRKSKRTRVLIAVKNPSDPELLDFLKANDIETNNDKLTSGKTALIVTWLVSILLGFGSVFLLLAAIIFTQVLEIIISRAQDQVKLLIELGFTADQMTRYFMKYVAILILLIVSTSVGIYHLGNHFITSQISAQGYAINGYISWQTLAAFSLLIAISTTSFWLSIRATLNRFH